MEGKESKRTCISNTETGTRVGINGCRWNRIILDGEIITVDWGYWRVEFL